MARIWGIIRIKDKIAADTVAELEENNLDDALDAICHRLDITRPVVLKKHRSEYAKFYRTRFLPDDFMEHVSFQCLEIEYLREKKKKDAFDESRYD